MKLKIEGRVTANRFLPFKREEDVKGRRYPWRKLKLDQLVS